MALLLPGRLSTMALESRQQNRKDKLPHDNYGPSFNAAVWLLTGLAAVFLALRLYCKYLRRKSLWWDDYVLIASFVLLIVQTSLLSAWVGLGFGKHTWDITDFYHYNLVANVTGVCSIVAAAWSKTAFAITLLRVSTGWVRRLVWFIIVTVNLFLGLSALFTFVQCRPIPRLWDSSVDGECWPHSVMIRYNSFSSSWSGVMDIVLAAMPWWIINRRSLSKKERVGVLVAMSMGVFAGVASIAKTATLWAIADSDTIHTVSLMIMATAETAITIVAASIPVLRALIKDKRALLSAAPRFYRYYLSRDGSSSSEGTASTATGTAKVPLSPYSAAIKSPLAAVTRKSRHFFFGDKKSEPASPPSHGGRTWPRDDKPPVQDASWLSSASAVETAMRSDGSEGMLYEGRGDRKGSLGRQKSLPPLPRE